MTREIAKGRSANELLEWYGNLGAYTNMVSLADEGRWMAEKSFLMFYFASFPEIRCSTGCWFTAATELGRVNELLFQRPITNENVSAEMEIGDASTWQEWCEGHADVQRYRCDLRRAQMLLSRAVTNVYPMFILPSLPASEGNALMTNMLLRAGILQGGGEDGRCGDRIRPK